MSLSFDNLIAIHAELFPETDFQQQCHKFAEEKQEMTQAIGDDQLDELADMFIVSAGVARFDYAQGITRLYETISYAYRYEITDLLQAVEKKVEKLKKRVWVKDPVVGYKHTKGIED